MKRIHKMVLIVGLSIVIVATMFIIPINGVTGLPIIQSHSSHPFVSSTTNQSNNASLNALWAYASGSVNEFGGTTSLYYTAQMPSTVQIFIISQGPSSFSLYINNKPDIVNEQFTSFYTQNITLSYGYINMTFDITSQTLGLTRSLTYAVSVVQMTTYINYLQQKAGQVTSQIPTPVVVGFLIVGGILIFPELIISKGLQDRREHIKGGLHE